MANVNPYGAPQYPPPPGMAGPPTGQPGYGGAPPPPGYGGAPPPPGYGGPPPTQYGGDQPYGYGQQQSTVIVTQQQPTVIQQPRKERLADNVCLHIIIIIFCPFWIFVWILLCVCETT